MVTFKQNKERIEQILILYIVKKIIPSFNGD